MNGIDLTTASSGAQPDSLHRGPGVPAEESARIFEPFYSTKESTGLGLSICYSIVTQHGGELAVQDREGGGAIFRIRFPAAEARVG